jgi:hypothetical protein
MPDKNPQEGSFSILIAFMFLILAVAGIIGARFYWSRQPLPPSQSTNGQSATQKIEAPEIRQSSDLDAALTAIDQMDQDTSDQESAITSEANSF